MSSVPPVPSASGVSSPQGGSSMVSGLVPSGQAGTSASAAQAPDQDEQARGVMNQIRDLSTNVQALARQYPDAAEAAQKTLSSLKDMMVSIVSSLQQSAESPAATPRLLG